MSDDIDDLKFFIEAKFNQESKNIRNTIKDLESRINKKYDGLSSRFDDMTGKFDGLSSRFDDLSGKFDGLSVFVSDAITESNEIYGKELKRHSKRITRLEKAISQ